jgi:hypothetical protein
MKYVCSSNEWPNAGWGGGAQQASSFHSTARKYYKLGDGGLGIFVIAFDACWCWVIGLGNSFNWIYVRFKDDK